MGLRRRARTGNTLMVYIGTNQLLCSGVKASGLVTSGKRQCVTFTAAVGGNDRARPQKIEQEGQERISRLAGRNGRALRSGRYRGDQAHGRHCASRGRRGDRPSTLVRE